MAFIDGLMKTKALNIAVLLGRLDSEGRTRGCRAGTKHMKIDNSAQLNSTKSHRLSIGENEYVQAKNFENSGINVFSNAQSPALKLLFLIAVVLTNIN